MEYKAQERLRPLTRREFLRIASTFLSSALWGRVVPALAAPPDPLIVFHGKREVPSVALTFDDCISCRLLQELERRLDRESVVKVTFFPAGFALVNTARRDPGLWKRLIDRGHEVGYHGHAHEYASCLSPEEMRSDFVRWCEAFGEVLGSVPDVRFARPPYGDLGRSFLQLCRERNLVVAMWSANWGKREAFRRMRAGDIGLLHIRQSDVDLMQEILLLLHNRGFQATTLSELCFPDDLDDGGGAGPSTSRTGSHPEWQ